MATIERLDDNTPPGKVIYTDDVLLQRNIEIYEKLKESGKIPGMCVHTVIINHFLCHVLRDDERNFAFFSSITPSSVLTHHIFHI